MTNRINERNNNKIFIDIDNRHDRIGLTHHSIHSHRLREIISKILKIFCCCFQISSEYQTANQKFSRSYFGFETFKLNLNEKVYYVTKADYEKWKQESLHPFFDADFSKDFLSLIGNSKVTLSTRNTNQEETMEEISGPGFKITRLSHSQNGQLPSDIDFSKAYQAADYSNLWKATDLFSQVSSKDSSSLENPSSEEITNCSRDTPHESSLIVINDAQALIEAFDQKDIELKTILSSVSNEIFEEAIIQAFGNQQINAIAPDYKITSKIKKIYPLLNEEQVDILIRNMVSPEWVLECFPSDENLMKKVMDQISTDLAQMQSFFKDVDHFITSKYPIDYRKDLAIDLIKRLAESKNFEEEAKKNPFGLKTALSRVETEQSLIDLILNNTSLELAFKIFIGSLEDLENHPLFVLTILQKVFAITRDRYFYSLERIAFSFSLLERIKASDKANQIFREFSNCDDGNGTSRNIILTFINSCIIAALRTDNSNEYLDFLMNNFVLMVFTKPTLDTPNIALENNLSDEEKERFLTWCNRNHLMSGAAFRVVEEDPNFSDVPRDMA